MPWLKSRQTEPSGLARAQLKLSGFLTSVSLKTKAMQKSDTAPHAGGASIDHT